MMPNRIDTHSAAAHQRANKWMPGGVSSPVRAFKSVGCTPLHASHASGCYMYDVDGQSYIDYVLGYGPMILGHAQPEVTQAVQQALEGGCAFGLTHESETELAELIVNALPAVERVRFVNSGTEAVMSALRLARGATKRNKIIKCTGCYHGHADGLLVAAGSGAATLGVPDSPGVQPSVAADTLIVPYNNLQEVAAMFEAHGNDIAAMIVEPVAGNMGCVQPVAGYLQGLRELCDKHDALLIFDEVMTGFRVDWQCAQGLYGIAPDLVCLGKVMGGGMPCAAYGGRADLMTQMAPEGPIYQAGTLSGNPIAMAAGLAQLKLLSSGDAYKQLETSGAALQQGLLALADKHAIRVSVPRVGSMLAVYFLADNQDQINNFEQAVASNGYLFKTFFATMLNHGVMLAPSPFEAWFLSTQHTQEVIEKTLQAADAAFATVASELRA